MRSLHLLFHPLASWGLFFLHIDPQLLQLPAAQHFLLTPVSLLPRVPEESFDFLLAPAPAESALSQFLAVFPLLLPEHGLRV
jgi:hypothetical protein